MNIKSELAYLGPRLAVIVLIAFAGGAGTAGQKYAAWSVEWCVGMGIALVATIIGLAVLDGVIVRLAVLAEYERGERDDARHAKALEAEIQNMRLKAGFIEAASVGVACRALERETRRETAKYGPAPSEADRAYLEGLRTALRIVESA